jgi:rhamnogalacturonan endolyase
MWGDYALPQIETGNRVDRFLAGVASLDASTRRPCSPRGYYTRFTLVAYDWDGGQLN